MTMDEQKINKILDKHEMLGSYVKNVAKIEPKIDKLNKLYEDIEEEHKIVKQAIIQFART